MNFLAHAHLSDPDSESILGNMLADFVKGPVSAAGLAPRVARGMRLHRAVDEYVDTHDGWLATKRLLSPPRRRFAGLIVDMFYDHFLARLWQEYDARPLEAFTADVYASIHSAASLPGRAAVALPRMAEQDWLGSYARVKNIGFALDRISERSPRIAPIRGAVEELTANYEEMESQFRDFYPELVSFSAAWRERHPMAEG